MTDYFDRLVERTHASADTVTPVRRLEPADLAGAPVADGDEDIFDATDRATTPDRSQEFDGQRDDQVVGRWSVPGSRHVDPSAPSPETSPAAARLLEPPASGDRPSPSPVADGQRRAPAPTSDQGSDDPAHVVEFTPPQLQAEPSTPSGNDRSADRPGEHATDGDALPSVPGLAEMDRVLFGQAGLTPPWEQPSDAEPDDSPTHGNETTVVSPSEPELRGPERQETVAFVEHVPASAPEPPSAPAQPEPTVSIGSIHIEIVEPPAAPQPSGRGVPRARPHLGSSRAPRRTWGW